MSPRLVRVSDLDTWSFCNYALKLDIEGKTIKTKKAEIGKKIHSEIEQELEKISPKKETTLEELKTRGMAGQSIYGLEELFVSKTMPLIGRIDLFLFLDKILHVLDFKTSTGPRLSSKIYGTKIWDGHGVTLIAYGILTEENLGVKPKLGILYNFSKEKLNKLKKSIENDKFTKKNFYDLYQNSIKVPYNDQLINYVKNQIKLIWNFLNGNHKPTRSHQLKGRCNGCHRKEICPLKL